MTECSTKVILDFHSKNDLRAEFSGGELSSDGGVLLLAQADKKLKLMEHLSSSITDPRDPLRITHQQVELLKQRVYQIACGYEDADDCDHLRRDRVLKVALNRLPETDPDLSSQPTMTRLENRVTKKELSKIRSMFVDNYLRSFKKRPARIVLDVDGWDDPTHGQQEFSFYHGFYEQHMYFPVQISDAEQGVPIIELLRAGNKHPGKGINGMLRWLFWRIKKAFPLVEIILRGDSGFSLPEILQICERSKVFYVCGIARNAVLERKIAYLLDCARLDALKNNLPKARLFDDVYYMSQSWSEPRRVIMKAEVLPLGNNPRFLVTNMADDAQTLYEEFYVQRGEDCENRIKEFKHGIKADRLSCHHFVANQFRLYLHQAAYLLMIEIRKAAAGTSLAKAQVETLRNQLLKVAASITESVRRVWVRFASSCPAQQVFASIAAALLVSSG
jgi:hypothetical protein